MKAILRRTRISPKKANLVAGMVRGKKVTDALEILELMPKKGADTLYKVVQSAASNARANFSQNIEDLYISSILVTKGPTYKRSLPISRGRMHPIRKRTSHITVEVGAKAGEKKEEAKKKPAKKEATPKETQKEVKAEKPAPKKSAATDKKTEKAEKPTKK